MVFSLKRNSVLLNIILIQVTLVFSLSFNRDLFGVEFMPYIMSAESGRPSISRNAYTFEDVKTMMRIVSTKFTRVIITSVDTYEAPYIQNYSYYYKANVRARTAEAAALINRENNNKSLSVMIGVWNYDGWNEGIHWNTELHVAVEAAQIANSIYPGTVEGLYLAKYHIKSQKWANFTLNSIAKLRSVTAGLGLKIGSSQFCDGLSPNMPVGANDNEILLWSSRIQIVIESDISICKSVPSQEFALYGAKHAFMSIRRDTLAGFAGIKIIKPELDVMWLTHWPGGKNDSWNTVENFQDYWKEVENMANQEGYKVYLRWAFEYPSNSEDTRGWWKLVNNSLIKNVSGYVETISGKPVGIDKIKPALETTSINSGNDSWLFTGVIIAVCGVVLCTVLLAFILWRIKHPKPKYLTSRDIQEFKLGCKNSYRKHVQETDSCHVPALDVPYDSGLEIPKSRLTILWDEPLGGGNFGFVCKAIVKNGNDRQVALKMAKQDCVRIALKGLLSEIKILMYLGQHPNIVSICGAYTSELAQGVVYLAIELCPLGSLKDYLRSARDPKATDKCTETGSDLTNYGAIIPNAISISDLVRWSYEIACGMEHLEKKNVIHADLATRNVLLTSDKTAKITDFGLSRRLYEYSNYSKQSQEPLPWRWMAFESLKRTEFSLKSDVWSYGVTLWEIFSLGDLPFPGHSWSQDFIEAVENGLRLSQPRNASDEMYQEMRNCWQLVPEDRPSFTELRNKIKSLFEETKCSHSHL